MAQRGKCLFGVIATNNDNNSAVNYSVLHLFYFRTLTYFSWNKVDVSVMIS